MFDNQLKIAQRIRDLNIRVDDLETRPASSYIIKTDTGDPSGTYNSGDMVENQFDNTLKVWADGAWRQLISW